MDYFHGVFIVHFYDFWTKKAVNVSKYWQKLSFWVSYSFNFQGIWHKDPDCGEKCAVLIQDGSRQRKHFTFSLNTKNPQSPRNVMAKETQKWAKKPKPGVNNSFSSEETCSGGTAALRSSLSVWPLTSVRNAARHQHLLNSLSGVLQNHSVWRRRPLGGWIYIKKIKN